MLTWKQNLILYLIGWISICIYHTIQGLRYRKSQTQDESEHTAADYTSPTIIFEERMPPLVEPFGRRAFNNAAFNFLICLALIGIYFFVRSYFLEETELELQPQEWAIGGTVILSVFMLGITCTRPTNKSTFLSLLLVLLTFIITYCLFLLGYISVIPEPDTMGYRTVFLGTILFTGVTVFAQFFTGTSLGTAALRSIQERVKLDDLEAIFQLGLAYETGIGVNTNTNQAVDCFRNAANLGHGGAMYKYAILLYKNGLPEVLDEAMPWLQSYTSASGEALFRFGVDYETGRGVAINQGDAAVCYRKAAELGHPMAMCEYAKCLRDGNGLEKDTKQALFWFERALEYGNKVAEVYLKELKRVDT